MFVPDETEIAVRISQHRIFMSCIGGFQPACGDLQDAQPDGNEHLLRIVLADILIHGPEHLRGTLEFFRNIVDNDHGDHHEQRRGNTFSGYVCDHERQMVIIQQVEIIEVTAHFLGRVHNGIDIEFIPFRERRKLIGKRIGLDARCQGKFCADAFSFRRDALDFFNIIIELL